MVILGIVLLGAQAALTDGLVRDVGDQDRRTVALQLAAERIQAVQLDPAYGQLERRYEAVEDTVPGFPGFRRGTVVERTRTASVDYTTVTVTVEHAGLAPPVARTVVVGAP